MTDNMLVVVDKVITLEPARNQLTFNRFEEINHDIINQYLKMHITMLKLIVPIEYLADGKTTFDIRRNHLNYTMRVRTKYDALIKILLKSFLDAANCSYLEINGRIHRNGLYRDILSLEYDPKSFRQTDDSIREYMIQWMQKNVSRGWDSMIFFGGECTLLGKILSGHTRLQYFYTDFPSIHSDILRNYKEPHVELIDYDTLNATGIWTKDFLDTRRCCIVNTGFHGMGTNLATEIAGIDACEIFVISCNPDSWAKDWQILSGKYKLQANLEIRTNYSVWIYWLSSNC